MRQITIFIILTLLLVGCEKKTNYTSILEKLQKDHQSCLDKGEAMMLCSRNYSSQMDSMLNVVYKELMKKYDKEEQEQLRLDEREWLKKRDIELKKIWADVNKIEKTEDFVPQDDRMMAYDSEAKYIKKRVEELISKLESTK